MLNRILDDYRFSGFMYGSDGDKFISHGMADYENGIGFTKKSRFCIASLTKQFTAFAVMLCAEKALLDINAPVSRYIPEYIYGDKIAVKNLLDMTSGINGTYPFEDEVDAVCKSLGGDTRHKEYWLKYISCYISELSEDDILNHLNERPLAFEAGQDFLYSNFNYLLLGIIIHRVTGSSLGEFLTEHVFTVLGMGDTSFGTSRAEVKGYDYDVCTGLPDYSGADFGLVSTVDDLIKWCRALLDKRILSQRSYDIFLSPNKFGYCFGLHKTEGKNEYRHDGVMMTIQTEMSFDYDSGEIRLGLMNRLPEPLNGRRIMYYPIIGLDDGKAKLEVWDMMSGAEFTLHSLKILGADGETICSVLENEAPLIFVKNSGEQRSALEFTSEEERSVWIDINALLGEDYDKNNKYYLRAEACSTELSQLGLVFLRNGEWESMYYNVFYQRESALALFEEAISMA